MVISVLAGAVAAASEPSTMENSIGNPSAKYSTQNTTTDATSASNSVITMFFAPLRFSTDRRKNSPVLNAINAKAMSARKLMPSITFSGMIFKPNGPMSMPATMYAVTLGNFNSLVMRVSKKPDNNITATEMMICATIGKFCSNIFFLYRLKD